MATATRTCCFCCYIHNELREREVFPTTVVNAHGHPWRTERRRWNDRPALRPPIGKKKFFFLSLPSMCTSFAHRRSLDLCAPRVLRWFRTAEHLVECFRLKLGISIRGSLCVPGVHSVVVPSSLCILRSLDCSMPTRGLSYCFSFGILRSIIPYPRTLIRAWN